MASGIYLLWCLYVLAEKSLLLEFKFYGFGFLE